MLSADTTTRTEPTTEPVTVKEICDHLRVEYRDHDAMLAGLITSARKWLEEALLWRCLIGQTVVDQYPRFTDPLRLTWAPASAIDSVTYVDTDGVEQTLSIDVYELGDVHGVGVVRLKYNQTFPTARDHADAISVTYTAGYGTAAGDVPRPIRHAMKLAVEQLYDGHDDLRARTIEALCAPFATDLLTPTP